MLSRRALLRIHLPAAIILAAVALNLATGAKVFTSLPHPDLARMQSYESAIDEVFRDPSQDEQPPTTTPTAAPTPIDNAFHFGWLPSGFTLGALSVLTFTLPAGLVLGASVFASCRKPRTPNSNK